MTEANKTSKGDLKAQTQEQHEARTTLDGYEGVDPRLDNRTGADRPPVEKFPAKPQQIDGPDLMHHDEHVRETLSNREEADKTPRKGMFSPGPHGLSDETLRESDETRYGTEGLTESEAAKGDTKVK